MKRLILLPILALSLYGCNTREMTFSQSNTKVATIFWNSDAAQVIQIGSVDEPYAGSPAVAVRVGGKVLFDSAHLSPEAVANLVAQNPSRNVAHSGSIGGHPSSRSLRSDHTWGEGALSVDLLDPAKRGSAMPYEEARRQDVCVIVKDGAVRAIRVTDFRSDPTKNVVQVRIGNSSWVDSRLSRQACTRIFGEPAEDHKYFTE
jgi:hypothetical protein